MQNKSDNYSQVVATAAQLEASGFELVWENDNWRLWRIPDGQVELADASPTVQPPFDETSITGSPP
jgi:hypothetical protein